MSVLDELKARSGARNAGATNEVPPTASTPTGDNPAATSAPAARRGTSNERYCAYWIDRLEAVRSHAPDALEQAVRAAIQRAPARWRPPVEDGRLLVQAGRGLPAQDLIDWLRVRARCDEPGGASGGALAADAARYWLRRLDGARVPDTGWAALCQEVARDAVRVGQGLDPRLVDALIAHPQAALGYLRAAGTKGQFREADAKAANLAGAADPPAPRSDSPASPEADAHPETPPPPRPGGPDIASPPPGARAAPYMSGGGVGLRLGGLAGGAIGGAVAAARAGFSSALRAAAIDPGAPATGRPARSRGAGDRPAREAEAEAALAAFGDAADGLGRHPKLAAFWEALDREAETRFQGQRAGVFREMCAQANHPLRRWFERVRDREPEIALRFEQSQAAFASLEAAWMAAGPAKAASSRWAPSSAQLDLLRAACRQVPPDREHPPLVERAERLVKALSAVIRQTFEALNRRKSAATRPAPSP